MAAVFAKAHCKRFFFYAKEREMAREKRRAPALRKPCTCASRLLLSGFSASVCRAFPYTRLSLQIMLEPCTETKSQRPRLEKHSSISATCAREAALLVILYTLQRKRLLGIPITANGNEKVNTRPTRQVAWFRQKEDNESATAPLLS